MLFWNVCFCLGFFLFIVFVFFVVVFVWFVNLVEWLGYCVRLFIVFMLIFFNVMREEFEIEFFGFIILGVVFVMVILGMWFVISGWLVMFKGCVGVLWIRILVRERFGLEVRLCDFVCLKWFLFMCKLFCISFYDGVCGWIFSFRVGWRFLLWFMFFIKFLVLFCLSWLFFCFDFCIW